MKSAVLSISGGLDSTCLLLKLLANEYSVMCYTFDYGQKHIIEQQRLQQNIEFLQGKGFDVQLQRIDLRDVFSDSQSSLHQGGPEIPEGHYAGENMKSTVIENRNVIFASIIYGKALAFSKKYDRDVEIYLGIHAGDRIVYPDCAVESRKACEHTFTISNWGSERISYKAPFENVTKLEVLREGVLSMDFLNFTKEEQDFIIGNTWSCYKGPDANGNPCNKCGTCQERNAALYCNGFYHLITGEDKDLFKETCKEEIEEYLTKKGIS